MSAPAQLGAFVAALAVVFGAAFAAGAATDGDPAPPPTTAVHGGHDGSTPVATP